MADIHSFKRTVKITVESTGKITVESTAKITVENMAKITAAQPLAATRARGGAAGSKGLAGVAMTAAATLLAGAAAANTAVDGRAHLVKNALGATSVTAVVGLQPVPPAAARNRATAAVPADMAGGDAAVAIGASSAVVSEDATNLPEVVKNKVRDIRKVEEGGEGTAGKLKGGMVSAAAVRMRGVLGSMVRRGIAMVTKRGVKTAASGMDEVKTILQAARATTGVTIAKEGTTSFTGDLRHQQWRSCHHWTMSARLQSIQHSMVRHRCSARRIILTVLHRFTATRSTATRNAMDRQSPNKLLQRPLQHLQREPCLRLWPQYLRLPFSLPESADGKLSRPGVSTD